MKEEKNRNTMWDIAKDIALATQRKYQLTGDFWQTLIDGGAIAQQFHNTSASAWDIVGGVLSTGKHTVTSKTVAMSNPNTVREACCNYLWELHLALAGTNKVQPLGYKSVPGSRDAAHSSWRYSHSKMTTPLQQFCTLGIDQAFGT